MPLPPTIVAMGGGGFSQQPEDPRLDDYVLAATGVTDGDLLQGIRFFGGGARSHSLVMGYQSKQVRFVDTVHMFDRDRPPAVRL